MSTPDPEVGGFPPLAIGDLAGRAGKRPSLIRYYEQIGLLPPPVRVNGQRRYDPATLRTLTVIDTAQRAGLTLDETKALLYASPQDGSAIDRLREVADRKLPEIAALIERAELVRGWLECAARCECPDLDTCPLFDAPPSAPRHHTGRGCRPRLGPNRGCEPTTPRCELLAARSFPVAGAGQCRARGCCARSQPRAFAVLAPGRAQIAPLWMRLRAGARAAAPAHSGGYTRILSYAPGYRK
jgi:DNA-binding transcriptional MerR regulator